MMNFEMCESNTSFPMQFTFWHGVCQCNRELNEYLTQWRESLIMFSCMFPRWLSSLNSVTLMLITNHHTYHENNHYSIFLSTVWPPSSYQDFSWCCVYGTVGLICLESSNASKLYQIEFQRLPWAQLLESRSNKLTSLLPVLCISYFSRCYDKRPQDNKGRRICFGSQFQGFQSIMKAETWWHRVVHPQHGIQKSARMAKSV